jgi:hypothetical protein
MKEKKGNTSNMDVLKKTASEFNEGMWEYGHSLEKFDSELNSKLLYINKNKEKLRFLSYLKDMVETEYQEHLKECREPDPSLCTVNQRCEIALYSIKQQYDDYLEIEGGVSVSDRPAMQYFSNGQYFDAFTAIKECVKEAKKSIVLVDNFIDADTLAFFPGKEPSIKLRILTTQKSMTDAFQRAVDLYNKQYENLFVSTSKNYHDRFLIVDEEVYYHIGASIKDAGNKTFMFSKIDDADIQKLIMEKVRSEWSNILV